MLVQVLAVALCLYLSVSVTSLCSIEMEGRIELVLACMLLSTYPTLCCKEIQVIYKNEGTSFWNFVSNSGLRKFCFGIYRSSKRVIDLAQKSGCSERDKLDRCRSTKLTILRSSYTRLRVHRSDRQSLSTGQYSRVGQ